MKPLYISKEEVAQFLSMEKCIGLMEEAFRSLANADVLQPLRSIMWLPEKTGGLGMMPAYSADKKMMGIKLISVFPGNKKFGYPSHQGAVLLFESEYGKLSAIVDADEITAIRTAAVSALATKLLARDIPSTLAILGSGIQAMQHVEAMLCVRKINSIKIWSRDHSNAAELAAQISKKHKVPAIAAKDTKDAIIGADIICTATASPTPLVLGKWIKKGAHINAVGSCTPGTRELDTSAIINSKLYTDRYESIYHESGDFIIPKKEGAINDDHVKGELAELMTGIKKGRETDDEITIFKSLGIAIEDVYAAEYVYKAIIQKNGLRK
jgi:alanine dehydrogenase